MSEYDAHLAALQNLYNASRTFRDRFQRRNVIPNALMREAENDVCRAVAQVEKTLRNQ